MLAGAHSLTSQVPPSKLLFVPPLVVVCGDETRQECCANEIVLTSCLFRALFGSDVALQRSTLVMSASKDGDVIYAPLTPPSAFKCHRLLSFSSAVTNIVALRISTSASDSRASNALVLASDDGKLLIFCSSSRHQLVVSEIQLVAPLRSIVATGPFLIHSTLTQTYMTLVEMSEENEVKVHTKPLGFHHAAVLAIRKTHPQIQGKLIYRHLPSVSDLSLLFACFFSITALRCRRRKCNFCCHDTAALAPWSFCLLMSFVMLLTVLLGLCTDSIISFVDSIAGK